MVRIAPLLVLAACSNSGLNDDAITPTGDTAGPTASEDCPWVGEWELQTVNCATFPYDDWYNDYEGASMDIEQNEEGGCNVQVTVRGAECRETEDWHMTAPVGISVDLTLNGISNCNPDGCTFAGPDAPCEVGDRSGGEQAISVDDATGDLQIVGALAETAPGCTLDVITTWQLR